jgi:hypothetical protein
MGGLDTERSEAVVRMDRKRWFALAVVGAVVIGAGTAVAFAAGDDDRPLTGSAYDRATTAALDETGGGTVIETEGSDDDGETAYGVEIRLDDGSVVEVELDENFAVLGTEADDDAGEGAEDD